MHYPSHPRLAAGQKLSLGRRLQLEGWRWGVLGALLWHFSGALGWLLASWTSDDYGSGGFIALLLIGFFWRRLPAPRALPRQGVLWGLVAVAGLDLLLAPLGVNLVSALLAVLALHLWSLACYHIVGRWWAHPQLLLGVATLPLVHWGNVLFGFELQQLATRVAGAVLRLYGAQVQVEGSLLRFPQMVVAVDQSCSGVRLLVGAFLFGVLAQPKVPSWGRFVLFWLTLLAGVVVSNIVRVMALAVAHLWKGGPPTDAVHQGVGLVLFALLCVTVLQLFRPAAELAPSSVSTGRDGVAL